VVIAYERHNSLDYFVLQKDGWFNNKHGAFDHNMFIGKPYGSLVPNNRKDGYLYALKPTPELWSLAITTRTQIVDEFDQSFVAFHLDLYPGCRVIDTGTGSGCNTISFARAVAPGGHVFTYEFNETRAKAAKEEFSMLKLGDAITTTWRDVCADGFDGVSGVESGLMDAVFLDLPEPWRAVVECRRVLRPGRSLCSYSPCIEQVVRTCDALRASGFHSIRMVEVRCRPSQVKVISLEVPDMGAVDHEKAEEYFVVAPNAAAERLAEIERKHKRSADRAKAGLSPFVDDDDDGGEGSQKKSGGDDLSEAEGAQPAKRAKGVERAAHKSPSDNKSNTMSPMPLQLEPVNTLLNIPSFLMKGHTAFLTFATCPLS